jgi:hypothetical protein
MCWAVNDLFGWRAERGKIRRESINLILIDCIRREKNINRQYRNTEFGWDEKGKLQASTHRNFQKLILNISNEFFPRGKERKRQGKSTKSSSLNTHTSAIFPMIAF